MGNPEWAMDAKYDTFEGRLSHQDELDRNIEAFTINRNKYEVMELLQKYDISSAAVQMNEDLMEKDPQLKARNLFERLNHSLLGERNFVGIPIKMSETQPYIHKSAPLMGEDNSYVLREVLGLSDEEIKTLDDEGVLWPKDMPKDEFKEVRSLW